MTQWLQSRLDLLRETATATWQLLESVPALRGQAQQVLLGSDFALRSLQQDDTLLPRLHVSGALRAVRQPEDFAAMLAVLEQQHAGNEADYSRALRALRRQEMLRLVWRDITGAAALHATLRETSSFADAAIASATRAAASLLAPRHGVPPVDIGGLVVLAMGKLGGSELNFSSDVDLIFLFARAGETSGPEVLPLEEYFTRQARLLIRMLDTRTADGFVFRVDMRLRPFGDSGPLVASFAFLEDYLQSHGRDWERYAYIKARPLTEQHATASLQSDALRPFVYRRYLDFGVFESLREMKALLRRDVVRRDREDHLKLGAGGIREIEFIVQALQLVRGGQESALREPSLLTVLPRLTGARLLPGAVVDELQRAYDFLRLLENRVQMLDDAQVHSLPVDTQTRERVALALGFADGSALEAELNRHRAVVMQHFAGLFAEPVGQPAQLPDLAALWEPTLERAPLREQLRDHVADPVALLAQLDELCSGSRLRRLDESGRKRLQHLLELLIGEQGAARDPDALRRLFSVLEAIGQRSAYFSLLVENRPAREQLLQICRGGNFLAAQLAQMPALLDEFLDQRRDQPLPDRSALQEELQARAAEIARDDIEAEVEALCRFKRTIVFRVALADLSGRLPLMQVSDRLTELAELILQHAMQLGWQQMSAQLGAPCCTDVQGQRREVRIATLAYGKLGGHELGYGSDLDLIFLHDSVGAKQETDAASPIDNQIFFLRYAQRVIHLLTMHSAAGRLYEVDVRLRPSGKGGMLVTSIESFRRYQFEDAWTWEHQALLHARAVAGDADLMRRIDATRSDVLQHAVRRADLQQRVREMRERMRLELSAAIPGQFDLKQDRGGIADIEFLAQYWALRWAVEYPPVVHFSDTIRQLESVASAALVPQETVDQLAQAYRHYRGLAHRRSLESLPAVVADDQCRAERETVAAIWRATMDEPV